MIQMSDYYFYTYFSMFIMFIFYFCKKTHPGAGWRDSSKVKVLAKQVEIPTTHVNSRVWRSTLIPVLRKQRQEIS